MKTSEGSRSFKSVRLDSDDDEPLSGFEMYSEEEAVLLTTQVTRYTLFSSQTKFVHLIIYCFESGVSRN